MLRMNNKLELEYLFIDIICQANLENITEVKELINAFFVMTIELEKKRENEKKDSLVEFENFEEFISKMFTLNNNNNSLDLYELKSKNLI